jgi:hypothetical protein
VPLFAFALSVPELQLSESLDEKKRGGDFLQLIWDTDLVIFSTLAKGLQTRLDKLQKYCKDWCLKVNPNNKFGLRLSPCLTPKLIGK